MKIEKSMLFMVLFVVSVSFAANPKYGKDKLLIDRSTPHGSPTIYDWDGDGLNDILFGEAETGKVWFYRNIGTLKAPKLVDSGAIQADGADLVVLHSS